MTKIRTAFDPKEVDPIANTSGESLTKQSERGQADMTTIMRKYEKTGVLPPFRQGEGVFADVSGAQDLHTAFQQVEVAQAFFGQVPSEIRDYVDNYAPNLVALCVPERSDELVALGIFEEMQHVWPKDVYERERAAQEQKAAERRQAERDAELARRGLVDGDPPRRAPQAPPPADPGANAPETS